MTPKSVGAEAQGATPTPRAIEAPKAGGKCYIFLARPINSLPDYPYDDIILAVYEARCESSPNRKFYYVVFLTGPNMDEIADAIVDDKYEHFAFRDEADFEFITTNEDPNEFMVNDNQPQYDPTEDDELDYLEEPPVDDLDDLDDFEEV